MDMITSEEIEIAQKFYRKDLLEVETWPLNVKLKYERCTVTITPHGKSKNDVPFFSIRVEKLGTRDIILETRCGQSITHKNGFLDVLKLAHNIGKRINEVLFLAAIYKPKN